MEVRWVTSTARDLAHCGGIQGAANRSLAGAGSAGGAAGVQMSSKCLCLSSQVSAISTNSLYCENGSKGSFSIKGLHFSNSSRAKNARYFYNRGRKMHLQGLRDDSSFSKSNKGVLILRVVQSLPSNSKGESGNDQLQRTKASSDASQQSTSPPSSSASATTQKKQPGFFGPILSIPKSIWRQVVLPLSNFGFGKTSIWEGGVGLFVISGAVLLAITLTWVKGTQIRSRSRKYEAVIEFSRAQGITVGTPVRIRGVDVGSVVAMRPSLERIDVVVQLMDTGIVIPRNALVEVNQSGLISETLIDVTPRDPLPRPTVGPLDSGCSEEGLIVCDRERIKGEQGVSLDELVGICTKIAKQMNALGMDNMYSMAERVTAAIDDAKPLLAKVEILAGDVEPLLKELKDGVLLKDLERLTKVVAEAGDDLRTLNKTVLTAENTELLRQSVATLTKTLKHIESISQDVSGLTGDAGTKKNLRQLIESLSRLVMD